MPSTSGFAVRQAFGMELLGENEEIQFDDDEEEAEVGDVLEAKELEGDDNEQLYGSQSVRDRGGLWLARTAEIKTTGDGSQLMPK